MGVRVSDGGRILLHGDCPIEDAEGLLRRLSDDPRAVVDWNGCEYAHSAVIQVLLAIGPRVVGRPKASFLDRFVAASLEAR
jgi:hypothetical protein